MTFYKSIFSGRLEFGTARSYEQVTKMYQHRTENYYRNLILLDAEEIFDEETYSLDVPRFITEASPKAWKNTVNLLEYVAQYAVSGNFRAWMLENGKKLNEAYIEPQGDKVAVQQFLKGRELLHVDGMEAEARKALTKAITKFERHAFAYERRGFINFKLGNYDDAIYDYKKSISASPNNAEPYLGLGYVRRAQKDYEGAIEALTGATKVSIPHQPIYWQALRLRGEMYLQLKQYDKAIADFARFSKRKFAPDNPNYKRRVEVLANYGKALIGAGKFMDAIEVINQSLEIDHDTERMAPAEQLLYRGIALQKAGKSGFVKDWKEAAKQGSREAAELLETV